MNDLIPSVSITAIATTFRSLHEGKIDRYKDSVAEAFKKLSWNYKTNNPCKFGKK